MLLILFLVYFFFFNDTATTEIYPLSLHDALPSPCRRNRRRCRPPPRAPACRSPRRPDRKSTRLNSSHVEISYAVFCLKKKKKPLSYSLFIQKKNEIHSSHFVAVLRFLIVLFYYCPLLLCFFFNDTATTEIYTLSLHDALPIWSPRRRACLISATTRTSSARASLTRSEEHTSELQSRRDLVCRLLLEKKKKKIIELKKKKKKKKKKKQKQKNRKT